MPEKPQLALDTERTGAGSATKRCRRRTPCPTVMSSFHHSNGLKQTRRQTETEMCQQTGPLLFVCGTAGEVDCAAPQDPVTAVAERVGGGAEAAERNAPWLPAPVSPGNTAPAPPHRGLHPTALSDRRGQTVMDSTSLSPKMKTLHGQQTILLFEFNVRPLLIIHGQYGCAVCRRSN